MTLTQLSQSLKILLEYSSLRGCWCDTDETAVRFSHGSPHRAPHWFQSLHPSRTAMAFHSLICSDCTSTSARDTRPYPILPGAVMAPLLHYRGQGPARDHGVLFLLCNELPNYGQEMGNDRRHSPGPQAFHFFRNLAADMKEKTYQEELEVSYWAQRSHGTLGSGFLARRVL